MTKVNMGVLKGDIKKNSEYAKVPEKFSKTIDVDSLFKIGGIKPLFCNLKFL